MEKINFLPKSIKKKCSTTLFIIFLKKLDQPTKILSNSLSSKFDVALFDEKIYKIADSLANSNNLL